MTIVKRTKNRTVATNSHKGAVIRLHKGEIEIDVHHGHDIVFKFRSATLVQLRAAINFVKEDSPMI